MRIRIQKKKVVLIDNTATRSAEKQDNKKTEGIKKGKEGPWKWGISYLAQTAAGLDNYLLLLPGSLVPEIIVNIFNPPVPM